MPKKFKIHFCGSEGINWALDHDLQHLRRLTKNFVQETSADQADIIHSVWWRGLLQFSEEKLRSKVVIGSIADNPRTLMQTPEFLKLNRHMTAWLCEYYESLYFVQNCGFASLLFPDPIEIRDFEPPKNRIGLCGDLKNQLDIPQNTYLIANFHRDSSMTDLALPKKQKGADLFLEIMTHLCRKGLPVHLLLAGPRRHYLRTQLRKRNIPFTFVGNEIDGDDCDINTKSLEEVSELLKAVDLYLITSRWEGAPNAVLESAATRTKILSTAVGQSPDILHPAQIFDTVDEAVELITMDVNSNFLNQYLESAYIHIQKWNIDIEIAKRLKHLYENAALLKKNIGECYLSNRRNSFINSLFMSKSSKISIDVEKLKVGLFYDSDRDNNGISKQKFFIDNLKKKFEAKGIKVKSDGYRHNDFNIIYEDHPNDSELRLLTKDKNSINFHLVNYPDFSVDEINFELLKKLNSIQKESIDGTLVPTGWHIAALRNIGLNIQNPLIFKTSISEPRRSNKEDKLIELPSNIKVVCGSRLVGIKEALKSKIEAIATNWSLEFCDLSMSEFPIGTTIYLATKEDYPGSYWLHLALANNIPIVYPECDFFKEVVEMGGKGYRDEEGMIDALNKVTNYFESFQNVIWPDSIDDQIHKLISAYKYLKSV
ncbi:MAG: glycosyltransferase [Bacteroidota bacterium]